MTSASQRAADEAHRNERSASLLVEVAERLEDAVDAIKEVAGYSPIMQDTIRILCSHAQDVYGLFVTIASKRLDALDAETTMLENDAARRTNGDDDDEAAINDAERAAFWVHSAAERMRATAEELK